MSDLIRKDQTLPADFAAELQRMRDGRDPRFGATLIVARMNGWTCQSLATPLGVSRQAIDQMVSRSTVNVPGKLPDIPLPPRKPQPERKPPRRRLLVNNELAEQLRAMQRTAAKVNGATPADAPERRVSEEFTAHLNSLVLQGVSIKHLAKVLGVQHNAVVSRLARHGYRKPYPSQSVKYLGRPNEKASGEQTHCKHGHELSGDNLYVIPKTGSRICRACHKARHAAYRERKRLGGAR
jgi:DNA-directed RNA polymerase specialized sigma24 family protein